MGGKCYKIVEKITTFGKCLNLREAVSEVEFSSASFPSILLADGVEEQDMSASLMLHREYEILPIY